MLGSRAANVLRRAVGTLHTPGISVNVGASLPSVSDLAVCVGAPRSTAPRGPPLPHAPFSLAPNLRHPRRRARAAPTRINLARRSNVTFVNYAGERRVLTGLVGESVLAVAQRHRYKFVDGACGGGGAASEKLHKEGSWAEPKYGEGASCYFCHVVVAKAHAHALPPMRSDEEDQLKQYPFKEDMSDTSRLACQINLTKACVGGVRARRAARARAIFSLTPFLFTPPLQHGWHASLRARRPAVGPRIK